jgi:hypothetical protein
LEAREAELEECSKNYEICKEELKVKESVLDTLKAQIRNKYSFM